MARLREQASFDCLQLLAHVHDAGVEVDRRAVALHLMHRRA
jgi:hypothetical protein